MVITDLNKQNFEQFYDCFIELMQEGYGNFSPRLIQHFLDNDYKKVNFLFWLERDIRKILLATKDDKVVGFLMGDHSYGGVAFISWFGIQKQFRRNGIGTQLFRKYEDYALTKGAHLIELFTFPELVEMYNRFGFVKVGVREQGYYGQKNIIMNKKLGNWSDASLPA